MTERQFEDQSCSKCKFIGHYFGYDVWRCGTGSIIARDGNGHGDYSSMPIDMLIQCVSTPDRMVGSDSKGYNITYQEHAFAKGYHRAMILGLLIDANPST